MPHTFFIEESKVAKPKVFYLKIDQTQEGDINGY